MKEKIFDDTLEEIEEIISQGYVYYVISGKLSKDIDPWAGMPAIETEYFAFDNKEDAEDFASKTVSNPYFRSSKNEVLLLKDLLDDRIFRKESREKAQAEYEKRSLRQREFLKNLPQWRKTRTRLATVNNKIKALEREIESLRPEWEEIADELKRDLDSAGIKYDSIDQVLTKEFLKNN